MSRNRKLVKVIRKNYRKFCASITTLKKRLVWLLRTLLVAKNRRKSANAGFVLPTVAMVSIVVVLLTLAIMIRSFDRSQNATNVRVNEAVLKAATPAIDRARAKINKIFGPGSGVPRATPTDKAIENLLNSKINEYTFGDETNLRLSNSTNNNTDFTRTAWRYPVDTDNNGKFDSYVLYGIYFKNPPVANGQYTRARNPLEARTPPMIAGKVSGACNDILGTSATLVGSTGWSNISGKLKKSFYVYTATVPITNKPNDNNYENYKGNKGFSAIEYQQDRVQLPLVNNAVVYEDDIALTPGADFNLNGRIITNSNFITGSGSANIKLYQVSSKDSCFYEAQNAKIIVGGNLGSGGFRDSSDLGNSTSVDLFQGKGQSSGLGNAGVKDNKSVTDAPNSIAYNNLAYVQRINALVAAQTPNDPSTDPQEVKDGITADTKTFVSANGTTPTTQDIQVFRQNELRSYFQKRTRRVPYAEVSFGNDAVGTGILIQGSGDNLRPKDAWAYPTDPTDGKTGTNYAKLALNGSTNYLPSATEPGKLAQDPNGKETYLGDRVSLGNNLPQLWWNSAANRFFTPSDLDTQTISSSKWDSGTGNRTRRSQIQQLADLGAIERDGDWEQAAAQVPLNPQDPVGGLRVVTSAGIYLPSTLTLSSTQSDFVTATGVTNKIWSDMMPVPSSTAAINVTTTDTKYSYINFAPNNKLVGATPGTSGTSGTFQALVDTDKTPIERYTAYLRMRATAVYHYASTGYTQTNPKPIACISSYYDPTSSITAQNFNRLPFNSTANGNSNNGVVYPPPTKTEADYSAILNYQASLQYPNGRLVNEALQTALGKSSTTRTLADKSAIDAAICSLQILDGSITPSNASNAVIPHGAIRETAFLDGRQVKAIHADNAATTGVLETFNNADNGAVVNVNSTVTVNSQAVGIDYDLPLEQRQPLEIRATVIDVNLLRGTKIGAATGAAQEYLLPNSGIIYATREDALLDLSATKPATGTNAQKQAAQQQTSRVDFILDPTRRPNGIMLVNGDKLWRQKDFRDAEKGFILASNLPVYIKGNFNLHGDFNGGTQAEFTTALADNWSNFYTRTSSYLNVNFACRSNDPRLTKCTIGDEWRPASILSDAVSLMSTNYREGYRNEGDYDLNNNLGDQVSIQDFRSNGFLSNAYLTNANWYDTTGANATYPKDLDPSITNLQGSSYVNNFVTPVQRRANQNEFNEYLMEVCPKLPVSSCKYDDWQIDPSQGTGKSNSWNFSGDTNGIIGKPLSAVKSGTTALAADPAYQNYPRRVAFRRDSNGNLVLDSNNRPRPLGIDNSNPPIVLEYPYTSATFPRKAPGNALWFKTTTDANSPKNDNTRNDPADNYLVLESRNNLLPSINNLFPSSINNWTGITTGTKDNPILVPVLQIRTPFGSPSNPQGDIVGPPNNQSPDKNTAQWLQVADDTTFNLAAAGKDTPARPTEDNGGLHNFVRFLESWSAVGNQSVKARISGSFIQTGRSAYASGPFSASLSDTYKINNGSGLLPFYTPPTRQWGYDVGLLSQSPDLFAQKLVQIPDDLPDEYYREVSRDDNWVQTLLCAKQLDANTVGDPATLTPAPTVNAVDDDQRPAQCN